MCLSFLGILVFSLAGLSACGQSANTPLTGDPIVIGASLSTSGDFAYDGKAMEQGYQLWADTVNKSTGLQGRPVKLDIPTLAHQRDVERC